MVSEVNLLILNILLFGEIARKEAFSYQHFNNSIVSRIV